MFNYYQPTKIHFGEKRLDELGTIAKKYGNRCFLVTTGDAPLQPLYDRVKGILKNHDIEVCHFDKVQPNPTAEMIEEGFSLMKTADFDFVLAVGGGSSIDSAKALSFTYGMKELNWDEIFTKFDSCYEDYPTYNEHALPLISVPTTSGTGSQVTQAAVISRGSDKVTFFHPELFSKETILDPELMLTLPPRMSAATGFDAFTHAFESFINPHASVYSEMDSLEAMRLVIRYLPKVMQDLKNLEYRSYMSMADTLAGRALANSGASAPHPLSEIIGGVTHLPHGEALAVVFPSFVKHFESKNIDKFQQVKQLFDEITGVNQGLYEHICEFLSILNLDKKLKDFNVQEEDMKMILASPILNYLPFGSSDELKEILNDAY